MGHSQAAGYAGGVADRNIELSVGQTVHLVPNVFVGDLGFIPALGRLPLVRKSDELDTSLVIESKRPVFGDVLSMTDYSVKVLVSSGIYKGETLTFRRTRILPV